MERRWVLGWGGWVWGKIFFFFSYDLGIQIGFREYYDESKFHSDDDGIFSRVV